ncbi:MAG: hypothetical protein A2X82_18240 [Geobacteraceae bacterium GWC2_55_20]|nr:MAG: hypothetical protein A2X83_07045 [Desulfuromonadales bacterium GWD2_54_10]OGU02704.1 MAG: hypothetical protein A2X82_18240 [Geobacteraceae bacterium GWC2_55_20]HBA73507.1 hypothetical protein [Geobacter sp.]HCE68124.1 hypothetical protein [Geobacter sp.]
MITNKSRYAEIGRRIREIPPEKPAVSYEWEELVRKLCASDDAGLHGIGVRELELLRLKCPDCPAFKKS